MEQQQPRTLILPAQTAEFDRLREWLEVIFQSLRMPVRACQQLLIAADEIFTNIAAYAYPGTVGTVGTVEVRVETPDAQTIQLHFFDGGVPFDPLQQGAPDTTAPLEQRSIGGLGIAVVKKMTDGATYEYCDKCNHLILVKHFEPTAEMKP